MKTFEQQMLSYVAYHKDARNKFTHFFGVPLVTFSILVLSLTLQLTQTASADNLAKT